MRRYLLRNEQLVSSRIVSSGRFVSGTTWNYSKTLPFSVVRYDLQNRIIVVQSDGREHTAHFDQTGDGIDLVIAGFFYHFTKTSFHGSDNAHVQQTEIRSEIPGRIVKVCATIGQVVERGAPLIIQEAMKMEITLAAPARIKVQEVLVEEGVQVDADAVLIRFEAALTHG